MNVEVTPETFTLVDFSSEVIADIASEVGRALGLPDDLAVRVEVDETTPLGRFELASEDPVVIKVESGALEDSKRPRQLSTIGTAIVLGLLLARVADRRSPGFADAPSEADITPHQLTAWEAYAAGRLVRLGYTSYDDRQRRLYHYRTRHGFSDVGDAAFERLWTADALTWAELARLSDESVAAVPA